VKDDGSDTASEKIDVNKIAHVGLRDTDVEPVIESDSPLTSVKQFTELGLREDILNGIYAAKYDKPSKIQGLAIPAILRNPPENFIGQAQSGTGKTAAFALSMISRVDEAQGIPQADEAYAMYLQGQRELSIRIKQKLPQGCQISLFSATYNKQVKDFP